MNLTDLMLAAAYVEIPPGRLAWALLLVATACGLLWMMRVGVGWSMGLNAVRGFAQLVALGLVLEWVFDRREHPGWTLGVLAIMLGVAGFEGARRLERRTPGAFRHAVTAIAAGGFPAMLVGIGLIVAPAPWFDPQYLLPMGGMTLAGALNATAHAMNRLHGEMRHRRGEVETALSLGASPRQSVDDALKVSMRAGTINTLNMLAIVGIVQIPGMMSGQIITGAEPSEAVYYQLTIIYMFACAQTIAAVTAPLLAYRRYFTPKQQLDAAAFGA